MENLRSSFKLLFGGLCLIVICIFGVFACKESSDVVNQDNQLTTSNSFLKFEGRDLSHTNALFRKVKKGDSYTAPFNVLNTGVTSENLSYIFSKTILSLHLEQLNDIDKKPELIVFYLKDENLSNVKLSNVVGVSIWFPKTESITEHRLFRLNKNNKFEIDSRFSVDCGTIINRDINYLAAILLKDEGTVNWVSYYNASLIVDNLALKNIKPDLHNFSQAVMNNADFILGGNAVMSCAGEPCGGSGYGCNPIGDCESALPSCPLENLNNVSSRARLGYRADLSLARNIRDNVMNKTRKGREYINYYYKISEIAHVFDNETDEISNADQIMLSIKLFEIVEKMQYGKDNDIIIDYDTKEKALDVIKAYKKISTNGEFQRILSTIEKDVLVLTLKEKNKVISYIE